ncbi:MAG: hypothetical protein HQ519_16580 [Planctomycetes bacterium]|nr:hypothetical protein [Planctomycetota bacterium]
MLIRPCLVLATLTAWPCLAAPALDYSPQDASDDQKAVGLDAMAVELRQRTAERRFAAATAWKKSGEALLKSPDGALKPLLMDNAPEIQDSILSSLKKELSTAPPDSTRVRAHLDLLQSVINASGADRVARLLPKLPTGMELDFYQSLCKAGGSTTLRVLEQRLNSPDSDQRIGALMALLGNGPLELCQGWLDHSPPDGLDRSARLSVLGTLSERGLLDNFRLPEAWLKLEHPREHDALFTYLLAHPQDHAEDFVLDEVLNSNNLLQLRSDGLKILEHGVNEFNWRDCKRKLGAILRDKDGDPLAEQTAWVLHRMDEKTGKKFLLAGPEAEVRRNRANWRNHLELGELQVKLSEFRDAFKSYKDGIEIAEARRGNLRSSDWLYAARAAAGARKTKEAGNWLARTRMSPSELAPYRDLPEFAPLLDKQPFKRLFGMPN